MSEVLSFEILILNLALNVPADTDDRKNPLKKLITQDGAKRNDEEKSDSSLFSFIMSILVFLVIH